MRRCVVKRPHFFDFEFDFIKSRRLDVCDFERNSIEAENNGIDNEGWTSLLLGGWTPLGPPHLLQVGLHSYYRYKFLIDGFPFLLISNGVYSVSTNLMSFLFGQAQGKSPRPVALRFIRNIPREQLHRPRHVSMSILK